MQWKCMVYHEKPKHGLDCTWRFSFLAPVQDPHIPHFAKALLHQNLLKASLQSRILCKQHWSNCRRVPTLRWVPLENLHNIWAFSMYCRYSSKVVAPTQRNSPLASSGFRRFPASIASFQTRSVAQMTAWLRVCVRGTSHLVPAQCQLQVHYLRAVSTLYDGKVRHHLHQHPQSYGFPQAIRSVKIRTIQWLQMNGVQSFCIVSFIDEGDDLAIWVLDFFQYSFQSFFEFTLGSAAVWRCLGWFLIFLVIHMSSASSHVYIDLPQGPRNFAPATMPPMSREITSKKHQGLAQGLQY